MNEINMRDLTALDILERQRNSHNRDICLNILRGQGALNASSIPRVGQPHKKLQSKITFLEQIVMRLVGPIINMPAEKINTLLVGLTLIVTALFQAILTPPGGLQQGNFTMNVTSAADAGVGNSVMDPKTYQAFFSINYVVFLFTAITIVIFIQFVTNSSGIGIIAEVLVALLTYSFIGAMKAIVPPNVNLQSRAIELKVERGVHGYGVWGQGIWIFTT
ncbi:hypothetical protein COLO4_36314 [Corchorus olitorius]|uniref:PGG domain-containing protein n=1 Tax=Corchorus olitorius TaxID=93759 RepID=A0A1R3GA34_9ROSI|nr:hypothetical protein COLO4_36314 [Corchorus olitorius]